VRACHKRVVVAAIAGVSLPVAAQQRGGPEELIDLLARVGARVEQYFARAQSIVCDERVRIQPLGYGLGARELGRELVYELRLTWDAASNAGLLPEATVLRQIHTINGRRPRPNEGQGCMDPKPVSPEPLSMLLAGRRDRYTFSPAGAGREGARAAVMLDYTPRTPGGAEITWRDDCVSVSLPDGTAGRLWADAETGDVLRLDEHLVGLFEFNVPAAHRFPNGPSSMVIERADSSTRYRPVTFQNPDETLMLPFSIESLSFWRGAATPRLRTTQAFSNCRRFLTDGRIVEDPDSR